MIDTDKYDNEGIELSDGGTICFPENYGRIQRIDKDGNTMEVRYQTNNEGQKWYELFDTRKDLLAEVKNQKFELYLYQSALRQMQEDTLKVVTEWFDVYGGDENEWRRLEQALGLPLTPLSWEGGEVKRLREGRLDLINEVVRIINNKTGERVDADLHDYIIDRLVNE